MWEFLKVARKQLERQMAPQARREQEHEHITQKIAKEERTARPKKVLQKSEWPNKLLQKSEWPKKVLQKSEHAETHRAKESLPNQPSHTAAVQPHCRTLPKKEGGMDARCSAVAVAWVC